MDFFSFLTTSNVSTYYAMSVPKSALSQRPGFFETLHFPLFALFAEVYVLSGWVTFQEPVWKRSCLDRQCSSQPVAQYGRWGVVQTLAALWWRWHACVALCRLRGWLSLRSSLRRGQVRAGSVDASAVFWWEAATGRGSVACCLTSSVQSHLIRRMLGILSAWLLLWASFASPCAGVIFWVA